MLDREQRAAAEQRLKASYLRLRDPSGEVTVGRIRFSANPRKWFIRATTRKGRRYPGGTRSVKVLFRTDVVLEAVLSPAWLDPSAEGDYLVSSGPKAMWDSGSFLIAGTEPIAPPPGIDRAEILHRTFFTDGALSVDTRMVFRFTRGPVTEIVGTGCRHRRGLAREIRLCAGVFHQIIAGHMRDRMKLTPVRRTA